MPKSKTIIIIFLTAFLVAGLTYFAINQSMKKQLANVQQIKDFNFKNITMSLRQVDMEDYSCFLIVYDSPDWKESRVFFNCPWDKK